MQFALDCLNPHSSVRPHARQNDPGGHFSPLFGQGPEKQIDGGALVAGPAGFGELNFVLRHFQVPIGRDDIHLVGLDGHAVSGRLHEEIGMLLDQFRQDAGLGRVQVGYDHKGHARRLFR